MMGRGSPAKPTPWRALAEQLVDEGCESIYLTRLRAQHDVRAHVDTLAEEVAEGVLGFVSLERNSMTARSLSLCLSAEGGYYYHSLDGPCDDGDSFLEDCGFVH